MESLDLGMIDREGKMEKLTTCRPQMVDKVREKEQVSLNGDLVNVWCDEQRVGMGMCM